MLFRSLTTAVLRGIKKYIDDPEFRQKVNDAVIDVAKRIFSLLDGIMKTIFGEKWLDNLKTGAEDAALAFAAWKAAILIGRVGFLASIKSATTALLGLAGAATAAAGRNSIPGVPGTSKPGAGEVFDKKNPVMVKDKVTGKLKPVYGAAAEAALKSGAGKRAAEIGIKGAARLGAAAAASSLWGGLNLALDRKSTRLNSSH